MIAPKMINPQNLYSQDFQERVKKYFPDIPLHVLETGGGALISYMQHNTCHPAIIRLMQEATSLEELKAKAEIAQSHLIKDSRHHGPILGILSARSLEAIKGVAAYEQIKQNLIAEYQLKYSYRWVILFGHTKATHIFMCCFFVFCNQF